MTVVVVPVNKTVAPIVMTVVPVVTAVVPVVKTVVLAAMMVAIVVVIVGCLDRDCQRCGMFPFIMQPKASVCLPLPAFSYSVGQQVYLGTYTPCTSSFLLPSLLPCSFPHPTTHCCLPFFPPPPPLAPPTPCIVIIKKRACI